MAKKVENNPYYERFKKIEEAIRDKFPKWKRNYLFYNNQMWVSIDSTGNVEDLAEDEDINELFPFRVKANRIPNDAHVLVASFMSRPPYITAIPRTASDDDKEKAEYTQRFIEALFWEQGLFDHKLYDLLLKYVLFGTVGIFKGYELGYEYDIPDVNGKPLRKVRYVLRPLTPFEFMFDPHIEDYDDQIDCFLIRTLNRDIAKEWYPNIEVSNYPYTFDRFVKNRDDKETVVIIEYYRRAKGQGDKGKLIKFDYSGNILYEGDNPYGEHLPVVYASYFKVPGSYIGRTPIDIGRVLQSVQNIIWSLMLHNMMLAGNFIGLAPEGSIPDDVKIEPGSFIFYDPTLVGQNQIPKLQPGPGIPQSWQAIYELLRREYQDSLTIHEIDYGRAPASASGKARELSKLYSEYIKTPNAKPLEYMFRKVAELVIYDVQKDVYGYWDKQRIMRYLGDDDEPIILEFKKEKITQADIVVKLGTELPYTKQQMTELALQDALQRLAKDPKDYEAKKIVEEFYRKAGIGYLVVDRSRDEKMAKAENKIIKEELLKLKLDGFEDIIGAEPEVVEAWLEAHKDEMAKLKEILDKIEPKPWDDHKMHLEVHYEIVKSPEFLEYPNWARIFITAMIEQHMAMMGGVFSQPGNMLQSVLQKQIAPLVQPKLQQKMNPEMGGLENAR